MKYSIVIPCYNESENLDSLIKTLKKVSYFDKAEFILVENGSVDNSRECFEKNKNFDNKHFKKVYVDKNQGYGYGLLQGLKKAKGKYVGWLHADLQVNPEYMADLIKYVEENKDSEKLFLKGKRKNRSVLDYIFTGGMTVYETILFGKKLNDIGAIPVLFNRELLDTFEKPPYDFSIELYSFYKAKSNNYFVKRFPVILETRKKGSSSWNKGFSSKIKQSKIIMNDSIQIRKGVYK